MSIRSTTKPEYNLFTAADYMSYSNKVVFAFDKSFTAEAAAAIPGLPLILQGYCGLIVWTWFTEEAKDETEAYEWDPNLGCIAKPTAIDIDDDYITLAGWEDLDNDINLYLCQSSPPQSMDSHSPMSLGKISVKMMALSKPNNSFQNLIHPPKHPPPPTPPLQPIYSFSLLFSMTQIRQHKF